MAKQSLGCARPTRGWQPVQAHHHHFPHELHNSMGPEMGMHLWLREPPFLWKLPLSCFKHYSDALFVRLCANVFLTAHVCEGWGQCEYVVYFYYVAGHTAHMFACECTHSSCAPVSVRVCEVGAAECYHRLVGHSSAANQRSKWLWVSPHQANLWPWY